MWRVAVKDLLYRRRRFITSVLATSVAFALALLLAREEEHLKRESVRIVDLFDVDSFLVAEDGTGAFSTTRLIREEAAEGLRNDPGVTAADPFVQAREMLDELDVTASYSSDEAVRDLDRPMKSGTETIQIISGLLWLMAAGIVASMLYLAVTERTTDLATSKAMGVTNRALFAGLVASLVGLRRTVRVDPALAFGS